MKFKIADEVLKKYNPIIGVLVAKGINNHGKNEEIVQMLANIQKQQQEKYSGQTLSELPQIKSWRAAYSSFGAKPKKYRSCIEAFLKRAVSGEYINHINNLVDLYCYISLKYLVPAGGDDIDKVKGGITLTFAKGDEKFQEINSDEIKSPKPGEVVYKDNTEILCRRWNWRECDKTKMTEETKNAALAVEGLPPATAADVEKALAELAVLIEKYLGGKTVKYILSEQNSEVEF